MKIFNLGTIRLILLQNGTSRNLGARLIGAWSRSSKQRRWWEQARRREQVKWALQSNDCSVKPLWATFAVLWPIHRVLGHNNLINKGI